MDTSDAAYADDPSVRPVFVDESGRRSRWVSRGGWVITSLFVGYLLLVITALVGPSGLSRITLPGLGPLLPGPGAATLSDGTGTGTRERPQTVLEATVPPVARRTSPPSPVTSRSSPSPTNAGAAATSTSPGRSGTAPGQRSGTPTPSSTSAASPTAIPGTPSQQPPRSTRAPSPRPKPSRSR